LQKIHKIWTLWDEAAIAFEEANHSNEKRSPNSNKAFKIKARNGKASKHPYKRQRLCFETKEGKESRDTTAQPSMTDRLSRGKKSLRGVSARGLLLPESPLETSCGWGNRIGTELRKQDNPRASNRQQVRQWVASWHAHLGDRATPGHLVNAITKKGLAEATQLRDQVIREFHLGSSAHL